MATPSDDYRHLVRVAVLFLVGLAAFLAVRTMLMPPGFGTFGHYRAGALADVRARSVTFAGQQACADCHEDVVGLRSSGKHARVACESCHGPLAAHVADPGTAAATKPDPRALCIGCHARNRSRPTWFPQVVLGDHSESGPCSECHQPHKPGLS